MTYAYPPVGACTRYAGFGYAGRLKLYRIYRVWLGSVTPRSIVTDIITWGCVTKTAFSLKIQHIYVDMHTSGRPFVVVGYGAGVPNPTSPVRLSTHAIQSIGKRKREILFSPQKRGAGEVYAAVEKYENRCQFNKPFTAFRAPSKGRYDRNGYSTV